MSSAEDPQDYPVTAEMTVHVIEAPECGVCGKTPPRKTTQWLLRGRKGLVCSVRCAHLAKAFELVDTCAHQARILAQAVVEGHGPLPSESEWGTERRRLAYNLQDLMHLVDRMTPEVRPNPFHCAQCSHPWSAHYDKGCEFCDCKLPRPVQS